MFLITAKFGVKADKQTSNILFTTVLALFRQLQQVVNQQNKDINNYFLVVDWVAALSNNNAWFCANAFFLPLFLALS